MSIDAGARPPAADTPAHEHVPAATAAHAAAITPAAAPPGPLPRPPREPVLTTLVVSARAPRVTVADRDGQIVPVDRDGSPSAHGHYDNDRRVLSVSELTVDG